MPRPSPGRILVLAGAAVFLACSLPGQTRNAAPRKVFVVAVRDSSLFTLYAPPDMERKSPDGWRRVMNPEGMFARVPSDTLPSDSSNLDRSRPDWREVAGVTPGVCPSGWVDAELCASVEKEVRKHKVLAIVSDRDGKFI